jgi:hypothetical protein
MHLQSPMIHKLQIGDMLQCRPETGMTIWNDEPVVFIGLEWDESLRRDAMILFFVNEGEMRTTVMHPSHVQNMINDEEIEVLATIGSRS